MSNSCTVCGIAFDDDACPMCAALLFRADKEFKMASFYHGRWIRAMAERDKQKAVAQDLVHALADRSAEIVRLRERMDGQILYSIALQRLIWALAHNAEIPDVADVAPHCHSVATMSRSSLATSEEAEPEDERPKQTTAPDSADDSA